MSDWMKSPFTHSIFKIFSFLFNIVYKVERDELTLNVKTHYVIVRSRKKNVHGNPKELESLY